MTSCCPGWVSFMEKHFPELGENLSTANRRNRCSRDRQKLPGAQAGHRPPEFHRRIGHACVAKKSEAARPEFGKDGDPDVNISITTRELAT